MDPCKELPLDIFGLIMQLCFPAMISTRELASIRLVSRCWNSRIFSLKWKLTVGEQRYRMLEDRLAEKSSLIGLTITSKNALDLIASGKFSSTLRELEILLRSDY